MPFTVEQHPLQREIPGMEIILGDTVIAAYIEKERLEGGRRQGQRTQSRFSDTAVITAPERREYDTPD